MSARPGIFRIIDAIAFAIAVTGFGLIMFGYTELSMNYMIGGAVAIAFGASVGILASLLFKVSRKKG